MFAAYVVVALPLTTFVLGRGYWFGVDDWDFLSKRSLSSLDDVIGPYNGHWSTVPLVMERVELRLFGLRYWPYMAVTMTMHLLVAVLLRALLRRAGVDPWIATATAGLFVLFGAGDQNMLWSFQIGMVGSVLFGLAQLWLAGMERPTTKTDALAVAAGVLGIMTSGVSLVMVGVVAVAIFLRRGWRAAAVQAGAPALAFVVWYAAYGESTRTSQRSSVIDWAREGLVGTFESLGHGSALGAAFGIALVGGLALLTVRAVRSGQVADLRVRASDAVALLAGAVALQVVLATGRGAVGAEFARSSRYLHVTAALVLVALGLAIDALVAQRAALRAIALVALVLPIPWNAAQVGSDAGIREALARRDRLVLSTLPTSPLATKVDRRNIPLRPLFGIPGPSIGWLLDAERRGDIPDPGEVPADIQEEVRVRLSVNQFGPLGVTKPKGLTCTTHRSPVPLRLPKGARIVLLTPVGVRLQGSDVQVGYGPDAGSQLRVAVPGARLQIGPARAAKSFRICLAEPSGT